jgi:hypothetical protein
VEVTATDELLRVAVIDSGAGFDPERLVGPSTDRAGGWGIALVAALAHRWGVQVGTQTSVWFEIDRPQRESVAPSRALKRRSSPCCHKSWSRTSPVTALDGGSWPTNSS